MGESIIRTILIAFTYAVNRASQNQANASIQQFVNNAMRSLRALGSVAATIAFDRIVQNLLDAASTAESVQFRFDNIYGELSASQQKWAEDFANTYNRSATVVKNSLASIQQSLIGYAPGGDRTIFAQMSQDIEELGLNLGAFYGMDSQTAVNTLLSAVQGSTGAMQQFGITDFAKYRHQAMADVGITDRSYALLTNQEKAMVNYQMVLNANKDAVDALSRSQNNYATKLQNFNESLQELREVLGEFFLPTAKKILDIIIGVVRVMDTVLGGIKRVTDALGLTNWIIGLLTVGIMLLVGIDVVRWGIGIIQILAGLAAQAGITTTSIRGFIQSLRSMNFTAVGAAAGITAIVAILLDLINYINGNESVIGKLFERFNIGAEEGVKIAKALRDGIIAMTVAYLAFRIAVLAGSAALAATPIGWLAAGIGLVIGLITLLANNADGFADGFTNAIDGIGTALQNVGAWFRNLFEQIGNFFRSIGEWIDATFGRARELWQGIRGFFRGDATTGAESGADMVNGMADGIRSAIPNLEDAAEEAAEAVADNVHFSVPKKGPLSDFDKSMPDMMNMMASGIQRNRNRVIAAAANVASGIKSVFSTIWQGISPRFENEEFNSLLPYEGGTERVSITSRFMDWMAQNNGLLGQAVDYLALLAGANNTAQMAGGLVTSKTITLNPTFTFTQTFNADTVGAAEMQAAAEESGEDITSSLARYLRLVR